MFMIGFDFFNSPPSLLAIPSSVGKITKVTIENGIYDRLRGDSEAESDYSTQFSDEWTNVTDFDAEFNGDLNAGNADFTVENTDYVRVKRRDKDGRWITLFQYPIEDIDDFDFHAQDLWAQSGVETEYAVIPVSGSNEGEFNIEKYTPYFCGLHIADNKDIVLVEYNVNVGEKSKNIKTSVVGTLTGKYPYVIENGENNYFTIPIEAFFYDPQKDDVENVEYRNKIVEWLNNGKPKIFKTDDGYIWLARVTSAPMLSPQTPKRIEMVSFEITEIGDPHAQQDLVLNGILENWGDQVYGVYSQST